jgi:hypothetical protein
VAKESSVNDFGLLIAYVLPGFVALWGAASAVPSLRPWFGLTPDEAPTVGGFLFLTVASVGAGLVASTVRWLTVDALHHRTGIRPPAWDFGRLGRNVQAFAVLVDGHYRYYQFYANTLVALAAAYGLWRVSSGWHAAPRGAPDLAFAAVELVLFLGSRDTLRKYYRRAGELLRAPRTGPPRRKSGHQVGEADAQGGGEAVDVDE